MTDAERWPRVRDLFERAFEEKPGDVGAWLDREGVVDWQLREEVLSLMQHHASAGAFLVDAALPELLVDRSLEPGQILGKYTIVREVGRGGMGRVYLAKDGQLGRMVALKALSPHLTADGSHRERLQREARAAAALNHPGICTVHALEEFDGELYIATEFVDGHTLRQEIQGSRPPAREVVRAAQELAAALGHAHSSGIAHRDLKPENVMRARDGRLKILDFGLARIDTPASDTEPQVTREGALIGTPVYMAPEQLNGQRGDARSDVFTLGVILFEYACGTHPFDAATPLAKIARILEGTVDTLDSRRSDLPYAVVSVIDRCLSKTPANRFASAAEIVEVLDRVDFTRGRMTGWWRAHQFVVVALYFLACGLAWQIKEWRPGMTTAIFFAVCTVATVAGLFRGHVLFTERVNAARLTAERQRAAPVLLVADLALAVALAADGMLLAANQPLAGVLTMALGVGIALARLVVEPATTAGSFNGQ
ncbi:MAG: serine/threonine-protein kinase [Vicinamibacterales bacterium]